MIAALLVIVSFRYSVGVFEPLWAVFLDDLGALDPHDHAVAHRLRPADAAGRRRAGRLSDRYGPRFASVLSAFGTIPLMGAYGFVNSVPAVTIMVIPHGLLEAIQSPGTQAALSDASPQEDAAAAQGLGEAAGSAAAAIGAFTAAPLFAALGAAPAWLIAGIVMGCLLTASTLLDRPRRRRPRHNPRARRGPGSGARPHRPRPHRRLTPPPHPRRPAPRPPRLTAPAPQGPPPVAPPARPSA